MGKVSLKSAQQVVVYKGDNIIAMGAIHDVAKSLKIKPETIRKYATPSYAQRLRSRSKHPEKLTIAVTLKEGDEL